MRVTFDPPAHELARYGAAAAVFERPAHAHQMGGERFERHAVAIGVLQAIDIDEQAVVREVARVTEIPRKDRIHQQLTAVGRTIDRDSTPLAGA